MRSSVKLIISFIILSTILADAFFFTESSSVSRLKAASEATPNRPREVRVGYSLSLNHASAIVGLERGTFREALPDVEVKTTIFRAGTSVVEGLFSNRVDIAYLGPIPAINGFVKSEGEAMRIVAGASSGGAVFVIRKDGGINSVSDLGGRKIASPALGNTQDVALRTYIRENGYELQERGGTVTVLPVPNSEMITLFHKGEVDGAWVAEPWGARLVRDAGARIFLDERDLWPKGEFASAVVVVRTAFLNEHPDIVERWLKAHVESILWLNQNSDEAAQIVNGEFKRVAGLAISEEILKDAFSRLTITYDPIAPSLLLSAEHSYNLGFLGEKKPDLSNIYDLSPLNRVLSEMGLSRVGG